MQHFFLKLENFAGGKIAIKEPDLIHQIKHVLRMKEGAAFIALDNTGFEFTCAIEEVRENGVTASILERRRNTAEPRIFATLYQAMPKKIELFELVLQKCTELGVSRFVPMITEFTERKELSKRERLERILREAAEQCERGKIPELRDPVEFSNIKIGSLTSGAAILLHCRGSYPSLASRLNETEKSGEYAVFIGPEGGFSEKEILWARGKGLEIVSLGPRVLRTETAAIAAASLILA